MLGRGGIGGKCGDGGDAGAPLCFFVQVVVAADRIGWGILRSTSTAAGTYPDTYEF